ncbi:hypothetical protein Aco03nite_080790 [Actinoplanes couchii]|uniref:Uncharacterized protein n=1 Tax=Actinoplanes couchii TaxID=403638 RepID=A0ABQ3XMI1_9ACTN|nr:hypothetical protein Aco03nite_080790 [Actinoplanes couchii]
MPSHQRRAGRPLGSEYHPAGCAMCLLLKPRTKALIGRAGEELRRAGENLRDPAHRGLRPVGGTSGSLRNW